MSTMQSAIAAACISVRCLESRFFSSSSHVAAAQVEAMNIVGEIKGKHCIIVDDMIDTAGTLCKSADSLSE